jgi:hypothetical protein
LFASFAWFIAPAIRYTSTLHHHLATFLLRLLLWLFAKMPATRSRTKGKEDFQVLVNHTIPKPKSKPKRADKQQNVSATPPPAEDKPGEGSSGKCIHPFNTRLAFWRAVAGEADNELPAPGSLLSGNSLEGKATSASALRSEADFTYTY